LADALRWQRRAIENKQAHLDRALQAIRAAEQALDLGQPARPAILKRIIEVIDVQHDIELMKRYYSEEAWERRRRYYEEGPAAEWQALYREVRAVLGEDRRLLRSGPAAVVPSWRNAHGPDALVDRAPGLDLHERGDVEGSGALNGRASAAPILGGRARTHARQTIRGGRDLRQFPISELDLAGSE
jgi:hypothetical protein